MSENIMSGLGSYLPMILILVVCVVLMIVPQRKRDKKLKNMLDSIKVGDRIRTIGGVYGKVTQIKEDLVTVQTGPDKMQIVFSKSAIASIDNGEYADEGDSL